MSASACTRSIPGFHLVFIYFIFILFYFILFYFILFIYLFCLFIVTRSKSRTDLILYDWALRKISRTFYCVVLCIVNYAFLLTLTSRLTSWNIYYVFYCNIKYKTIITTIAPSTPFDRPRNTESQHVYARENKINETLTVSRLPPIVGCFAVRLVDGCLPASRWIRKFPGRTWS